MEKISNQRSFENARSSLHPNSIGQLIPLPDNSESEGAGRSGRPCLWQDKATSRSGPTPPELVATSKGKGTHECGRPGPANNPVQNDQGLDPNDVSWTEESQGPPVCAN